MRAGDFASGLLQSSHNVLAFLALPIIAGRHFGARGNVLLALRLNCNAGFGWAKVKARAKVYVTAAFSLLMTLFGGLYIATLFNRRQVEVMGDLTVNPMPIPDVRMTMGAVSPNTNTEVKGDVGPQSIMGNIAVPQKITRNGKVR